MNVFNVNSGNLVINGTLVIEGEYLNELGSTLLTGPSAVLSIDNSPEGLIAPESENLNLLNPRSVNESMDTLKIPDNIKSGEPKGKTKQG